MYAGKLGHAGRQVLASVVINSGLPSLATVQGYEALTHAATSKWPLHVVVKILIQFLISEATSGLCNQHKHLWVFL